METVFQNTNTTGLRQREPLSLPFGPENARPAPVLLQCEVMFGSPSSNCDGNGICKIVARSGCAPNTYHRTSCSHSQAMFASCDGGNGVSMLFRHDWLCAKLMKRHFRHGFLEMPEPCLIPPAFVLALGLHISELPAGLHLIENLGTHYRINFRFIE